MPAQPQGLMSGDSNAKGLGSPSGKSMMQQVIKMTADIDQALQALSGVFAANGGDEVGQARKLIEAGARKFLGQFGQAPSSSPTEAGSDFPGGGFSSNRGATP